MCTYPCRSPALLKLCSQAGWDGMSLTELWLDRLRQDRFIDLTSRPLLHRFNGGQSRAKVDPATLEDPNTEAIPPHWATSTRLHESRICRLTSAYPNLDLDGTAPQKPLPLGAPGGAAPAAYTFSRLGITRTFLSHRKGLI